VVVVDPANGIDCSLNNGEWVEVTVGDGTVGGFVLGDDPVIKMFGLGLSVAGLPLVVSEPSHGIIM